MKVKSRAELCAMYSEMSVMCPQAGVADPASGEGAGLAKLTAAVISSGHSAAAMELSKKGCPISQR